MHTAPERLRIVPELSHTAPELLRTAQALLSRTAPLPALVLQRRLRQRWEHMSRPAWKRYSARRYEPRIAARMRSAEHKRIVRRTERRPAVLKSQPAAG